MAMEVSGHARTKEVTKMVSWKMVASVREINAIFVNISLNCNFLMYIWKIVQVTFKRFSPAKSKVDSCGDGVGRSIAFSQDLILLICARLAGVERVLNFFVQVNLTELFLLSPKFLEALVMKICPKNPACQLCFALR